MRAWHDKEEFKACVRKWARTLDIQINVISMRWMRNKWASYTQKNDLLIFDARLLSLETTLGEYVIVHELLHFRVPNHGTLWKAYMNTYLPSWQELDRKLKQAGRQKTL